MTLNHEREPLVITEIVFLCWYDVELHGFKLLIRIRNFCWYVESFLAALSKICSKPGVYIVYLVYIWGMISVYMYKLVLCFVFFNYVDLLLSCSIWGDLFDCIAVLLHVLCLQESVWSLRTWSAAQDHFEHDPHIGLGYRCQSRHEPLRTWPCHLAKYDHCEHDHITADQYEHGQRL